MKKFNIELSFLCIYIGIAAFLYLFPNIYRYIPPEGIVSLKRWKEKQNSNIYHKGLLLYTERNEKIND